MEKRVNRYNYALEFYETYYFCNIIQSVIEYKSVDYLPVFDEFFNSLSINGKFEKNSIFHQFISFSLERLFYESVENNIADLSDSNLELNLNKCKDKDFWLNGVLDFYNIYRTDFNDWVKSLDEKILKEHGEDIIHKYFDDELGESVNMLTQKITNEIFHVLFLNRKYLLNFNVLISGYISNIDIQVYEVDDSNFKKNGVLKRRTIPKWVKNAVFYRDRGQCVYCLTNLTGVVNLLPQKNFDHIVPLDLGGVNDISNLQLTCEKCNKQKRANLASTTNIYQRWFEK